MVIMGIKNNTISTILNVLKIIKFQIHELIN